MMPSKCLERREPVREQVYTRLKTMVLSGELAPGERLTEEHLARELGVSRTPVREALHKLASEGLIQALPTRGFKVSGESKEEMEEVFELRAVLEGYALGLASRDVDPRKLEELEEYIQGAEEAYARRDTDEVFHWNTRFHDTLNALVSHRSRLHQLIADLRKYVLRYRKDTLSYLSGARRSIDGHKKIMLALRLGDPEVSERIMREHVREAMEDAFQGIQMSPTQKHRPAISKRSKRQEELSS